jgi:hypothetical protein
MERQAGDWAVKRRPPLTVIRIHLPSFRGYECRKTVLQAGKRAGRIRKIGADTAAL